MSVIKLFLQQRLKQPVLFFSALLLLISASLFLVWFGFVRTTDHQNIVLKKDGFHPSKLVIKEGDTVTFSANTGEAFWPASNVHPSHTDYPAFDPKKPVAPNDTWSFTFTEAGTYGFHDHIKSIFEGEIIVEKKDGSRVVLNCDNQKTQQCWEKMMLETLSSQGVEATFNQLQHLAETEPTFQNDCHNFSHLIGKEAYKLYVAKENFELTPATALCGYGFYHGFMETMLLTTGNIDQAREFCQFVDQKLRGKASAAATACYHGTGHGAIDGSDPTQWGNIDAMMAPGFKLCGLLATNVLETYLCDTGVFNAIEILSADPKYGLSDMRKDPFAMCNKQPVARREGCYANMMPIVMSMFSNDFQKSMDYVNKNMIDKEVTAIDGNTINDLTILGLMFEYIRIHGNESNYAEKGITFCRAQIPADRSACIKGLSGGHIKYGKPGVEYVKNLQFCANTMLTNEERDSCYEYTLPRMSNRYAPKDTQMICAQVPVEYSRKYCPTS